MDVQPNAVFLTEAGRRIDKELNRRSSHRMVLSAKASERLAVLHAEYLADLGEEAVRIARRRGLETVDENHVIEACSRIGGPSLNSRITTAANTFGSVIAGAGMASAYTVTFGAGPHTNLEQLAALSLCVVGFVLLAVAVTVSFLKR